MDPNDERPSERVADAVRVLRLFNEKALELRQLSFIPKAFNKNAGASLKVEDGKVLTERRGADHEATAAMILTLRLFLQPRDGIQLQQIERLYRELPLPDEYPKAITQTVRTLDTFLDSPECVQMSVNGTPLTKRLILETFLYGDLAHLNEDKRPLYELIRSGPAPLLVESTFEFILCEIVETVLWLASINERAIKVLEGARP